METLKKMDWRKIITGTLIAAGGGALTYLEHYLVGLPLSPEMAVINSALIQVVRKVIAAYTGQPVEAK